MSENKVPANKTDIDRLNSYDRAMDASRLIRTKEWYEATERLARSADKDESEASFNELCEEAGITDAQLIAHMWQIIQACYYGKGKNYLAENPGPLW